MKMKTMLVALLIVLMTSIHSSQAQEPKKIPKIGYLSGGSASVAGPRVDAFRQGLRQQGYTEGQNIEIEFRYAGELRPNAGPRGRVGPSQG